MAETLSPVGMIGIIAPREQHLRQYWNPGLQKSPEAHEGAQWLKQELTAIFHCNFWPLFRNMGLLFLREYSWCVHCKSFPFAELQFNSVLAFMGAT